MPRSSLRRHHLILALAGSALCGAGGGLAASDASAVLPAPYDLTRGAATFGIVLPQGAATGTDLRLGALPTQVDVKNRWQDGSIRFAIVSADVPSDGVYPVTAGSSASGGFAPAVPTASVELATQAYFVTIGETVASSARLTVSASDDGTSGRLIADAIRLEDETTGTVRVMTTTDAGFAATGAWMRVAESVSCAGSVLAASYDAARGADLATWTFSGLTPGHRYRLGATWAPSISAWQTNVVDCPYTVWDGAYGETSRGTVRMNQQWAPIFYGTSEQGPFTVASGTLTLTLVAEAGPKVAADAVILCRVDAPGDLREIDDTDAGCSRSGSGWTADGNYGSVGAQLTSSATAGDTATWTFTGLPAGSYRLLVSHPGLNTHFSDAATYQVRDGSSDVGSFTIDQNRVDAIATTGAVYTAALPATASSDRWLQGPVVEEWRQVVTPLRGDDGSGSPHPFLRVYFDTRAYARGGARVEVTVENCLNVAGAGASFYDVAVDVDGARVFSRDGVRHWYCKRWVKRFDAGLVESTVAPDLEPFYRARAFPRFLTSVIDKTYSDPATDPDYDILGPGSQMRGMNAPGAHDDLAPYPNFTALYLVKGAASYRSVMFGNADLSGSWAMHLRESDGSYVSIDARPGMWFDGRMKQYWTDPDAPKGDVSPAGIGGCWGEADYMGYDTEHEPSLAYVPYLLTGDRYYRDELALTAHAQLLITSPYYYRNDGEGLIFSGDARAMAWMLRNLIDAALYLPDGDAEKTYLLAKVDRNLVFMDEYAHGDLSHTNRSITHPPFALGSSIEQPWNGGYLVIEPWEENFLAWSISHANDQGLPDGRALRDRMLAFQLQLFTSEPEYPRTDAAPYYLIVGTIDGAGAWMPFTTLAQVDDASLRLGGITPGRFAGYYGEDARLSLSRSVRMGTPGAQDALDYLMSQPGMPGYIDAVAGWAIDFSDVPGDDGGGSGAGGGGTAGSSGGGSTGGGAGAGGLGADGGSGRCGFGGGLAALAALFIGRRRLLRRPPA